MGDTSCNKSIETSVTGKELNAFSDITSQRRSGGILRQLNHDIILTEPRKSLPQASSHTHAGKTSSSERSNLRTDSDLSFGLPRIERRPGKEEAESEESRKDTYQDEPLDPRIQYLIVNLSDSATTVNSLQTEIKLFQQRSEEYIYSLGSHLEALIDDLGNSIMHSLPYYDAVDRLRLAEIQLQQASFSYARVRTKLQSSKEKIAKLEGDLIRDGGTEDVGTLTCLNAVTNSYAECHQEKVRIEREHSEASKKYEKRLREVNVFYEKKKRAVEDSKPFFVLRHQIETVIKNDNEHVAELESAILQAKRQHSNAVDELQKISTEIHQKRQEKLHKKTVMTNFEKAN